MLYVTSRPGPFRTRTTIRPVTLAYTMYRASLAAFIYLAIALTVTIMAALAIASIALLNSPGVSLHILPPEPASFQFLITIYGGNEVPVIDIMDHSLSGEDCITRLIEYNRSANDLPGIASCEQE